jgi:hypothetical protein
MIFDIPQELIDDLVKWSFDESNHLHIGYWILDDLKQKDDISYSKGNSVNFPSDKETT